MQNPQPQTPLGQLWNSIQSWLFPMLEDEIGALDEKHRQFVAVCELCAYPAGTERDWVTMVSAWESPWFTTSIVVKNSPAHTPYPPTGSPFGPSTKPHMIGWAYSADR
jgi:hypothetical protein